MRLGLLSIALACSACLTPRSIMQAQLAAPVGRGAVEAGVGVGVGYEHQNTPVPGAPGDYTGASALLLPGVEGNVHLGISDHLGLNAHFSPAGLQPGLKITVNKSRVAWFALMPQVAFGFGRAGSSLYVSNTGGNLTETNPSATTMFTFMLGLRAMVSHVSGFFAGIGYDFIATRSAATAAAGTANPLTRVTNTLQHSLMANVGYSIAVNWLRIRPEIAFSVQPAISVGINDENGVGLGGSGGFGFAILPGFSLVAVTPQAPKDDAAEEEQPKNDDSQERERDSEESSE